MREGCGADLKGVVVLERENFKSRLGFLLVSAGCAIGIGNVWKFPFITGQNGGGVFVLFYLKTKNISVKSYHFAIFV